MKSRTQGLCAGLMLVTAHIHAGRPLATDDADTVAPGDFEFEAGGTWHRDSGTADFESPFGVTAGLLPTLEAGIGFGSQIQEREEATGTDTISGIGDLALGLKWHPLPGERYWASHAVAFALKIPTASEHRGIGTGKTDCDLTYIASKSISGTWSAHLNAGYTWTGDPADAPVDNLFHAGVALGWRAGTSVEWVGEVVANVPADSDRETTVECNAGVRWNWHPKLTFDAALGTRLRGEAPDLTATLGLTWLLGKRSAARANDAP